MIEPLNGDIKVREKPYFSIFYVVTLNFISCSFNNISSCYYIKFYIDVS